MQSHAVAPDGGPAFDDDKRAAGDVGQGRKGLGGCDGRGDGDGVDDICHEYLTFLLKKVLKTIPDRDLSLSMYRFARLRISHPGMISQS